MNPDQSFETPIAYIMIYTDKTGFRHLINGYTDRKLAEYERDGHILRNKDAGYTVEGVVISK